MKSERPEERFVREFLFSKYGVELKKIAESTGAGQNSADFTLFEGRERIAIMEVKRLTRAPRTAAAGWKVWEEDGIWIGTRESNARDRVAKKLYDASNQLQNYTLPKILILVNDDPLVDTGDLAAAVYCYEEHTNKQSLGNRRAVAVRISRGKECRVLKTPIDLVVWLDRVRANAVFFRFSTETGVRIACKFFDCPEQYLTR